jgi:hypothetical protein
VLIPDRKPDVVKNDPMADEIRFANVVRVQRVGARWHAVVGPASFSLGAWGQDASEALTRLAALADHMLWPWDETWVDRPE